MRTTRADASTTFLSRLDASFDEPKSNALIARPISLLASSLPALPNVWPRTGFRRRHRIGTIFKDKIRYELVYESRRRLYTDNINRWIRDGSSGGDTDDDVFELFDLQHADQPSSSAARESLCYSHKTLSPEEYRQSRTACEQGLTTVYARHTILNMLEVWSHNGTSRSLEKFGDYSFLIGLLKLLDSTKMSSNEKVDRVHLPAIHPQPGSETSIRLGGPRRTARLARQSAAALPSAEEDLIIRSCSSRSSDLRCRIIRQTSTSLSKRLSYSAS